MALLDAAMLFANFGCTHPSPPYPALSAEAEPISKGHSRSDIMKLKVS